MNEYLKNVFAKNCIKMKTLKIAVRVQKGWWRFNVLSNRKIPCPLCWKHIGNQVNKK